MSGSALFLVGPAGLLEFDLSRSGEYVVGRTADADINVDHRSVSRKHAVISVAPDGISVRDNGSRNGTFVNGERIDANARQIQAGMALRFGDIAGQLHTTMGSRVLTPRVVDGDTFDKIVEEEAQRCIRGNSSLAVIAIEVRAEGEVTAANEDTIIEYLSDMDVMTVRSLGRVDVAVLGSTGDDAQAVAERIIHALEHRGLSARCGVAAFPDGVPSRWSVVLGAQLSMRSGEQGRVEVARGGARVLRIAGKDVVVAEPEMVRLYALIERVATTSVPALVVGETGTGKEMVAEALHAMGPRADRPLIRLNSAAVPENLLESELFGHLKGSFSGADNDKVGLFESADGGTLFLDEIGEMTPSLQAKLLRVLEDGSFRKVGSSTEQTADVRVVAATNRDLRAESDRGTFRQDLFYRLSTMVLNVPPLRDRPREIPLLCERFAADAAGLIGANTPSVSAEAMQRLQDYAWPGNIRELRNVVHGAVMRLDSDELGIAEIDAALTAVSATPASAKPEASDASLDQQVREFERARIIDALAKCDNNQTRAAEYLGMPRRTLVSKLKSLGIKKPKR